jgi:quercetin dioxygenase-like cupin family protein
MGQVKVIASDGGKHYKPSAHEDVYFKITGDETDGKFDYFDVRVQYLGGPPLHAHLEQDETFHILAGELRLKVGDEMIDAKEGEYIYIPKGTVHTYVNLKQEPARAVGVLSPGGFDKFVAEMSAYQSSVDKVDPAKVAEISARHKQRAAGPPLAVILGLAPGGPPH